MPAFKIALAACISLLPLNVLRVLGYRLLFGYRIRGTKVGFGTVLVVDEADIDGASIGLFNLFVGPLKITLRSGVSIGNRNTFSCGYWVLREQYGESNYARSLDLGANVLITSGHYFDLAGAVVIGERSWIAGIGSQFWTHGAGVVERNIKIGEDSYISSAVRFAPGSAVGDYVLVAMGSVVSSVIHANNALVGGVPAKVLKENYEWKTQHE